MKGEKTGLDLERLREPVIPHRVIGAPDLFREGELGCDHTIGKGGREVALIREPAALDGG